MTRTVFLAICLLPLSAAPLRAQDGGMEEFEEVDPYTEGDPEKMEALGYLSYGPFAWRGALRTPDVQELLGDPPILWVETEHFRIGSTLGSYRLGADPDEKDRIEEEFDQLKEKLGRFRPPRKKVDPWLRLHLYALRLEGLVADFHRDFGLEPADYEAVGPYLGQKKKHLVLLCQRDSELGRYVKHVYNGVAQTSYRSAWGGNDNVFFGSSFESIELSWAGVTRDVPFDAILHTQLTVAIASSLVDSYRACAYGSPRWLSYGLAYVYGRRVHPRWVWMFGHESNIPREGDWEWEPRVAGLVRNDFFAGAETMFGWEGQEGLKVRDHLIAWSKVDHLLRGCEGDRAGFLGAVSVRAATPAVQTKALEAHLELTPADWDETWARWVKKNYSKR